MNSFLFRPGQTILFQGDSTTDCGRIRTDPADLGPGYPNFVASRLTAEYPEYNLKFINRGCSGNRIYDLEERWTEDCINLHPDWVSVFIGINDTWRRYDSDTISTLVDFEGSYRRIMDRIKQETSAEIIIMEPLLLPYPADRIQWREDLDPKIAAVRRVAVDYGAILIPIDGIFAAAACRMKASAWAADGVHPTNAGSALIAQSYLDAIGF